MGPLYDLCVIQGSVPKDGREGLANRKSKMLKYITSWKKA